MMWMKYISSFLILLMSFFAEAAEPTSLTQLLETAQTHNPEIRAAHEKYRASKARISQAGAWDDPRFGVEWSNIPIDNPSLRRTPMSGVQYSLSQQLSIPGKKHLAKKAARFTAEAMFWEYRDTTARVLWSVRATYYDLAAVDRILVLLKEKQQVFDGLVNIAASRIETNMAPQQDALTAQLEFGKVADQLFEWEKRRETLLARLERLAGDPLETLLFSPQLPAWESRPLEEKKLLDALHKQPLLQSQQKEVEAARKNKSEAKLSLLPDIELKGAYRQRERVIGDPVNGEDFFSVGFSIPLPIFTPAKQAKRIRETEALTQKARAESEHIESMLKADIRESIAEVKRAERERALIIHALLPQSKAAIENAQAAYESGAIDFINVLTNEITLLHFEQKLIEAETAYHQAWAKLDYLTGGTL